MNETSWFSQGLQKRRSWYTHLGEINCSNLSVSFSLKALQKQSTMSTGERSHERNSGPLTLPHDPSSLLLPRAFHLLPFWHCCFLINGNDDVGLANKLVVKCVFLYNNWGNMHGCVLVVFLVELVLHIPNGIEIWGSDAMVVKHKVQFA